MKGVGERWMRDPETGKGGTVPTDMTYQEWKAIYVNKSVDYDDWKAKQSEIVPAARNFRIDEINREKVFFDENANYDLTIPSYSDAVNRSLSNACKEVAKRGSESGVEFLNIVDLTTGDLLAPIEEGLTDAVGFEQYQEFLDGNTKPFAFVHNHITETPMSYEDIQSFSTTKNMEVMISVTNNGLKYVVCGNKKTNKYLYSYYSDEIKNLTLNPPNGRITKDDIEKFIVEKAASEFGNIYAERLDGRVHN
ncbi:MAG: hypothetical protein IJU56_05465 [Clostridia bacterium]|nr:hypothetical protein [Clostridia bacterium]